MKLNRALTVAALVLTIVGTVLYSALDDPHWGLGCFIGALVCVTLAGGRDC
jgi:hypothetical protein